MRKTMEPLTETYYKACQGLGLDTTVYDQADVFQVMIGSTPYYFSRGLVPNNDYVGVTIASDKHVTNQVLRKAGIPVPDAIVIHRKQYKEDNWRLGDICFPVVAKPTRGTSGGQDVVCNIQSKRALNAYLEKVFKRYDCISIETFKPKLQSYRILMLDGKVIDYYLRVPSDIVGDGILSIEALIKKTGEEVKAGKIAHKKYPLIVNEETDVLLREQGFNYKSVPKKGQFVRLRYACNAQLGGYPKKIHDIPIHKDNIKIFKQAAKAVELNLVGIDLLCEDISKSIKETPGYIIEMNGAPDIRTHENPVFDNPIPVTTMIVENQIKKHPWFCLKRHLTKHGLKYFALFILCSAIIGASFTYWPF